VQLCVVCRPSGTEDIVRVYAEADTQVLVVVCLLYSFTFFLHFCEILMTKCIKRIRDLFEYALYKFTLYLLTYLLWPFDDDNEICNRQD